jgi:hypothetical protein
MCFRYILTLQSVPVLVLCCAVLCCAVLCCAVLYSSHQHRCFPFLVLFLKNGYSTFTFNNIAIQHSTTFTHITQLRHSHDDCLGVVCFEVGGRFLVQFVVGHVSVGVPVFK